MDMMDRSTCIEFVHCMFLLEIAHGFVWGFFSADNSPFNSAYFNKAAKGVMEACEDRRTLLEV